MDIKDLRGQIDEIDGQILALFRRRMGVAAGVAEYKRAHGLPLHDGERERALLQSRLEALEDAALRPFAARLFQTLMELSKGYQFQALAPRNIVLIGMMGSGKTKKGALLARRLGMEFVDVDAAIEQEQGKSVSEIFTERGAEGFRALEREKIAALSGKSRWVISTGGGAVLSEENMRLLKNSGVVVFLHRDIERIVQTIDTAKRPLLANGAEALYDIYRQRLGLYQKWADIEMTGEYDSAEDGVDELIQKLFS